MLESRLTMGNKSSFIISKLNSNKDEPFVHLQQLYEYELAPFTDYKLTNNGLYDTEYIQGTWSSHGFDIYVISDANMPIGFAVVNLSSMISDDTQVRDIAEFFIMPSYRNNNLGQNFAHEIFKKYPGKWELRQIPQLLHARNFWLKTIKALNPKDFQELTQLENWSGFVQSFTLP